MAVIKIGKLLVATEQIAFVELFDPTSNPDFKPENDFKARVVLLNREMTLIEQTPQAFAEEHKLHLFVEDNIAVNRDIAFRVETFEPTESFAPSKPFKTRIKWRDQAREEQSKLLVTPPETVIAELLGVKEDVAKTPVARSRRPARGRRGSRRMEGYQT